MSDEFSVEEVARYWDGYVEAWAEQVRRGADIAREWLDNPAFLAFVGDLRGRRVLDAGRRRLQHAPPRARRRPSDRRGPLGA